MACKVGIWVGMWFGLVCSEWCCSSEYQGESEHAGEFCMLSAGKTGRSLIAQIPVLLQRLIDDQFQLWRELWVQPNRGNDEER